jgi:hypothetical protein
MDTPNDEVGAPGVDEKRRRRDEGRGGGRSTARSAPTATTGVEAATDPPRAKRWPRLLVTIGVCACVALIGLASVSLLGRSASSKFSSVAMAICGSRVAGHGGEAPILPGIVGGGFAGATESAQVGGCGGGYASSGSSSGAASSGASGGVATAGGAPAAPAPAAASPTGQTSFGTNALDAPPPPGPAAAGHAFVSTATMTVMVDGDTAKAVSEQKRAALVIAANAGGGLFGEESTFDGAAKAVITLKVPSAQFTSVLDELARLGTPKAQDVKTDEVTLQVVDLGARLTAATNGLDRTRGLLAKATNLGDIAQLEADVNRRETEVENLRGQQAMLAQRVELSTIVLTLVSSAPVVTPPPPPEVAAPAPPPGFLDGLGAGWHVFTKGGTFVLAAVGWTLPFLPFVLAAVVTWWLLRRRSRTRPTPAGPAGAAAGG